MITLITLITIVAIFYFVQLISKLLAIVVVGFLIWTLYNQTYVPERFTDSVWSHNRQVTPFMGWQEKQYHNLPYQGKPIVDNHIHPMYKYWKYDHQNFLNNLYKNCDQYRCKTKSLNGYSAQPYFNLINGSYKNPNKLLMDVTCYTEKHDTQLYENPNSYCAHKPASTACPNHWIKN